MNINLYLNKIKNIELNWCRDCRIIQNRVLKWKKKAKLLNKIWKIFTVASITVEDTRNVWKKIYKKVKKCTTHISKRGLKK